MTESKVKGGLTAEQKSVRTIVRLLERLRECKALSEVQRMQITSMQIRLDNMRSEKRQVEREGEGGLVGWLIISCGAFMSGFLVGGYVC